MHFPVWPLKVRKKKKEIVDLILTEKSFFFFTYLSLLLFNLIEFKIIHKKGLFWARKTYWNFLLYFFSISNNMKKACGSSQEVILFFFVYTFLYELF